MKTGLCFLVAAKRCEIADLRQLAQTSVLVDTTARMIHDLQRERGLTNLFLGSGGADASALRQEQLLASTATETALRACFDTLNLEPQGMTNGARLFSRIAYVLQGLDALPALRRQVDRQRWDAPRATAAYVQLVAGLLAVVFEAADTATDPDVSRLLVSLFNFMQGKEFVGQERATGAAMFAAGRADARQQQRLMRLIESQEQCLEVFADFADADTRALWESSLSAPQLAELERMRRVLCTSADGGPLNKAWSTSWFDGCSARIDAMRTVEMHLSLALQTLCDRKLAQARLELDNLERVQATLNESAVAPETQATFFEEPETLEAQAPVRPLGSQLDRGVLDLLHAQAHRLQKMEEELDTVRASLNERKVIERAKGLLMAHRQLSEEDAHRTMRQMAMNQGRRLVEVAEAVLSMAEVLPARLR